MRLRTRARWLLPATFAALSLTSSVSADTFAVLKATDEADTNISDGSSSPPTLRAAIENVNRTPGPHTIAISPLLEDATIALTRGLPAIRSRILLEGKGIIVDGSGMSGSGSMMAIVADSCVIRDLILQRGPGGALSVQGNGNTIQGLEIRYNNGPGINLNRAKGNFIGGAGAYRTNRIYGQRGTGGHGISLLLSSTGNRIINNWIGTGDGLTSDSNSRLGILVQSDDNLIRNNIISGNNYGGIEIDRANRVVVDSNIIGADLSGTGAIPNGVAGVIISEGENDTVRYNLISGNAGNGVYVTNANPLRSAIHGNRIGTNKAGLGAVPNGTGIMCNGTDAVIFDNLISGNINNGIGLGLGTASVRANRIGVDIEGDDALPNRDGIVVSFGVGHEIGGDLREHGNVISGNIRYGVVSAGLTSRDIVIRWNRIGVDGQASDTIPNGLDGISIAQGALNTLISENVISGNGGSGIVLQAIGNAHPQNTSIQRNLIGTTGDGGDPLGNRNWGISLRGAINTVIGGISSDIEGNTIGSNGGGGIAIWAGCASTRISANRIGISGALGSIGNGGDGIRVDSATTTWIGPAPGVSSNWIAHNLLAGVAVTGSTYATSVAGNYIFENGSLGIDIGADLVDENDERDADDGPNNRMNAPALQAAKSEPGRTTITGSFAGYSNAPVDVQFFRNANCDPSGTGEGDLPLAVVSLTTDGEGRGSLSVEITPPLPVGTVITATAMDSAGNTSEFSNCVAVAPPGDGADLAVSIMVAPEIPQPGQEVRLHLRVVNNGPTAATNVVLRDTVPGVLAVGGTVTTEDGSATLLDSVVLAEFGTIAPDDSAEAMARFTGVSGLHVTRAAAAADQADPDLSNNRDTAIIAIGVAGAEFMSLSSSVSSTANGILHLELATGGRVQIEFYDLLGRCVMRRELGVLGAGQSSIAISDLNGAGPLFGRLRVGDNIMHFRIPHR